MSFGRALMASTHGIVILFGIGSAVIGLKATYMLMMLSLRL